MRDDELWIREGDDLAGAELKPTKKAHKNSAAGRNFLYAPMSKIARGLKAGGGIVWIYLLQQARMRGEKAIPLPNLPLSKLGVDRKTKARQLHKLEAAKLVRVRQQAGRAPRVTVLL